LTIRFLGSPQTPTFSPLKEDFSCAQIQRSVGQFFVFFSLVGGGRRALPNVFQSGSQRVPQVPKTFPIAPQFCPIWFAQSSTPMYEN